jgi:lysyl-tRNA synthetase class 2
MSNFLELSKIRHEFMKKIRAFFDVRGFWEVQTPLLVPNPGLEPHLQYFETHWNPSMSAGQPQRFFLPTSPEYHLKKALGQGLPKIFEISKSFRNGESSGRHEPEFLMLEWYRCPGDYTEIAADAFALFQELAQAFSPHPEKWKTRRDLTVCQAFKNFCKVDLENLLQEGREAELAHEAKKNLGISLSPDEPFDSAFHWLVVDRIEKNLGKDCVELLWDYPHSMAALSRRKKNQPHLCERFEMYWNGIELANAFGELTDSGEQERRFHEDLVLRRKLYPDEVPPPLDPELLRALDQIDQPCAGIAVGVERLLQCILEKEKLQDVLLFPKRASLEK